MCICDRECGRTNKTVHSCYLCMAYGYDHWVPTSEDMKQKGGVTNTARSKMVKGCDNCGRNYVTELDCRNCITSDYSLWELKRECMKQEDMVDSPSHYKHLEKEVIDIIKETLTPTQYEGFCMGNEMKYRLRAGYKTEDYNEDMNKAMWYKKERLNGK